MKLSGGDVEVTSGTGFRGDEVIPLVNLTAKSGDGNEAVVWMNPRDARRIGHQLLESAAISVSDAAIRTFAKEQGMDGDTLIMQQRALLATELP